MSAPSDHAYRYVRDRDGRYHAVYQWVRPILSLRPRVSHWPPGPEDITYRLVPWLPEAYPGEEEFF